MIWAGLEFRFCHVTTALNECGLDFLDSALA